METSPAEPYVTKIEIEGSSPVEATTGSYLRTIKSPVARERVAGSLGTIASLQEGLRTKLQIEPRSLHRSGLPQVPQVPPRTSVTLPRENVTLSPPPEASDHGPFSSSTPVRASFRRNRPQTMICLEENSHQQPTPVKRESRTRLKEIKSRRRWSSMEHGAGPSSTSSPSPAPAVTGASPALRNRTPTNVNNTPGVGEISPVTAREVGNSVERAESLCGDGTETRLMLESFLEVSGHNNNNNSTLAASTIFPNNSLLLAGIANDTIIEHENKSNDAPEGPSSLNSSRTQADPVIKWWMGLFMSTEPECMTYLQSKPILKSKEPVSPPSTPLAFYPYEMIKTTLVTKRAVLVTFSMLKSHFSALNLLQVNKTIGVVTKQIKDYIYEHNLRSHADPQEAASKACSELPGFRPSRVRRPREGKKEEHGEGLAELVALQERSVPQVVDRLRLCAHRCQYTPSQPLVE